MSAPITWPVAGLVVAPAGTRTDAVTSAARAAGWETAVVGQGHRGDKRALLSELAAALDLPAWFGHNWDALVDCLGDALGQRERQGRLPLLVVIEAPNALVADDRVVLVEILAAAAVQFASGPSPLSVVLLDVPIDARTDAPGRAEPRGDLP